MSPLPEAISVGSLSSLNRCGNPCGVRFVTAYFLLTLQHGVTLGWCRQWRQGKRAHFTVQCTAVFAALQPVYDPAVQQQCEGTGAGPQPTHTAFASCPMPASAAPPPPPPRRRPRRRHGGSCGGSDGLHAISDGDWLCTGAGRLQWCCGMLVCLFVSFSSFVIKFCKVTFHFSIGSAKIKITSYY